MEGERRQDVLFLTSRLQGAQRLALLSASPLYTCCSLDLASALLYYGMFWSR